MEQSKIIDRTETYHIIGHMNAFNGLHEALEFSILKVEWLLGRLGVDGFNRHINFRQKDNMVER